MAQFIEWSDEISVDDPVLDAQHNQVFKVINDLFDSVATAKLSEEELRIYLLRLQIFTETHFSCEEAYMKHAGFPHYQEHLKLHNEMAQKTRDYVSEFNRNMLDPVELLRFLKEWWLQHIRTRDQEYISYLARIGF